MKTNSRTINIPRQMTKGKELVVLTKDEYERLTHNNKEITKALRIIAEGERAYRRGKTIKANSLEEALKTYAKH